MRSRHNSALARALRQTGAAATRETLATLYPAVAQGDERAIKRMAEAAAPLAVHKAKRFARANPHVAHLQDDLTAEALLAVVRAVKSMANAGPRADANPVGMIGSYIDGALRSVSALPVSCPRITRHRKAKAGDQLPHTVAGEAPEPSYDPTSFHDLREELAACCRAGTDDARIVALRIEGYTDHEISQQVALSPSGVAFARHAIERRFRVRQQA